MQRRVVVHGQTEVGPRVSSSGDGKARPLIIGVLFTKRGGTRSDRTKGEWVVVSRAPPCVSECAQ